MRNKICLLFYFISMGERIILTKHDLQKIFKICIYYQNGYIIKINKIRSIKN